MPPTPKKKRSRRRPRIPPNGGFVPLPPGVFPDYAAHNPYLQEWLSLTPYERAVRSDRLRATIPDLRRVHDEKTFRDFGPL